MILVLVITTSMNRKRSTEVRDKPPFVFPFIIGVGSTTCTSIDQEVAISGKSTRFRLFVCQCVLSSEKLMTSLMMGCLFKAKLIKKMSDLNPFRETVV